MADKFNKFYSTLESPAGSAFTITPNDSTDFTYATRAIYVGGTGDIAVITVEGDEVTFVGAVAGTVLPIRVSRVKATDTTATDLIGLY